MGTGLPCCRIPADSPRKCSGPGAETSRANEGSGQWPVVSGQEKNTSPQLAAHGVSLTTDHWPLTTVSRACKFLMKDYPPCGTSCHRPIRVLPHFEVEWGRKRRGRLPLCRRSENVFRARRGRRQG